MQQIIRKCFYFCIGKLYNQRTKKIDHIFVLVSRIKELSGFYNIEDKRICLLCFRNIILPKSYWKCTFFNWIVLLYFRKSFPKDTLDSATVAHSLAVEILLHASSCRLVFLWHWEMEKTQWVWVGVQISQVQRNGGRDKWLFSRFILLACR